MLFQHKLAPLPDLKTREVDGKRHYVSPKGDLYPSVTTILDSTEKSKGLTEWRNRVGEEEADRYATMMANRGQAVHDICENYLRNVIAPATGYMPDAIGIFQKMKPHIEKINKVFAIEQALYSDQYRFAGRTDCIGEYTGTPAIIDFKTNNTELEKTPEKLRSYACQLGAYAIAWEELTGNHIDKGVLIFGSNDHGAEVLMMELGKYRKKFLDILDMFQMTQQNQPI